MRWFFSLSSPFWFRKKVFTVFAFLHLAHFLPYSLRHPSHFALKRQCHEIFDFWFFSWISFPQAPGYTIRVVSNLFENSRRYSQLKVHHQCRWHRWQICHLCRWYQWCTLTCKYLRKLTKKFETVLMGYSGAGGKLIHEKKQKQKSRDTVPLSTFRVCCILRGIWPKRSYLHVREC